MKEVGREKKSNLKKKREIGGGFKKYFANSISEANDGRKEKSKRKKKNTQQKYILLHLLKSALKRTYFVNMQFRDRQRQRARK